MPEWQTFSDNFNGKSLNGYTISCVKENLTDDSKPAVQSLMTKYNIESFPTIKAVKPDGGSEIVIEYDARVNYTNLEKFVQSISNN